MPVVATIVGVGHKDLVHITTEVPHGKRPGVIVATAGHPFWTPDTRTWTNATNLAPGDNLSTQGGKTLKVLRIQRYGAYQQARNLTVAHLHTYYVEAGGTPVLVHNCARGTGLRPDFDAEGPHTTFKRDPETGNITHYAEWEPQTNPNNPAPWSQVKRVDMTGAPHYDRATGERIPTPHVNLPDGSARPAEDWELTGGPWRP